MVSGWEELVGPEADPGEFPRTVTYELTNLGRSLQQMLHGIKRWAEGHMDEVLAHREKYDTRAAER